MDASAYKLLGFIGGPDKKFIIPVYQRAYSWKPKNCDALFQDLMDVYHKGYSSHFFGSLVYIAKESEYTVIDGQQRLTTVSLLLMAIRKYVLDNELEGKVDIQPNKILNAYLLDEYAGEGNKIKLRLIDEDFKAYSDLLEGREPAEDSAITVNFRHMLGRLSALSHEELSGLYNAISKLNIVKIGLDLQQGDDPQLIFESLNSTGQALTEADKIRNYVLMNLQPVEQNKAYKNYWLEMEKIIPDGDITDFVRYYLSIKLRELPAQKKIYFEFKHYRQGIEGGIMYILSDMLKYARYYSNIVSPAESNLPQACRLALIRLRKFEVNTASPLLMDIFEANANGLLTEEKMAEAFGVIESYLLRREVCGLETKSLNKIFCALGGEINKYLANSAEDYLEVMKYYILCKGGKSRFPNDHDFAEKFITYELFNAKGTIRKYILERLENCKSKERIAVEEQLESGELTIEHIMPQTMTTAWKREVGENWEAVHTKYKDTPGNITLTAYNSEYSNRPFEYKNNLEGKGFKCSKLYLNGTVKICATWGKKEIEARAKNLLEDARKIWPSIDSSINDTNEDNWVAWDEDYDFTNTKVTAISFDEKITRTNNLTEAYKKIHQMIYDMDPMTFREYFRGNPSMAAIRPYEIADGVIIETHKSSQDKMIAINKLMNYFEMSSRELKFRVEPKFNIEDESTYDAVKIGALGYEMFKYLLTKKLLAEDEMDSLKTKEFSHSLFKALHYPALADSRDDNIGNGNKKRYYAKPVTINNMDVYITSQWFEEDRDRLIEWFRAKCSRH